MSDSSVESKHGQLGVNLHGPTMTAAVAALTRGLDSDTASTKFNSTTYAQCALLYSRRLRLKVNFESSSSYVSFKS